MFSYCSGCAVLGFGWYVAVSRLHLHNSQCLEIFLDCAILFLRRRHHRRATGRSEEEERGELAAPGHPGPSIEGLRRLFADANQDGATVLGYNVHDEPWLWPDLVRMKHGVIVGGTGAGKSTFLENIIAQDVTRRFGARRMPMIIFDGKGEREFLDRLLPHIEAAGRLQDLRVIDPTHPTESARYNPFYALDDAYQEHVNFIFRSFGLREDFFKGHQEAYLSDLVRILQYTGKLFNVYDVLVMALDEEVLAEQIRVAKARLASAPGISMQKRLNFEMSVKMLQRSLTDRERVEKIQGLLNELLSFLEDELSVVTGSYQDLLTLDDVLENGLILFVSLNANRNQRAVEALGKILLQNIQLMVGKRYAQPAERPGRGRTDAVGHPGRVRAVCLSRVYAGAPDRARRQGFIPLLFPKHAPAATREPGVRGRGIVGAGNEDDHERLGGEHGAMVPEGVCQNCDQATQLVGPPHRNLLDEIHRDGHGQ